MNSARWGVILCMADGSTQARVWGRDYAWAPRSVGCARRVQLETPQLNAILLAVDKAALSELSWCMSLPSSWH